MLIKKSTNVGFQCCVCGRIGTHTMELFKFGKKNTIVFVCPDCGSEIFRAEKNKKGGYGINIGCPVCFTPHRYNLSTAQFWSSEFISLKCIFENSAALILGTSERIEDAISNVFEPFGPFEPFDPSDYYFDGCDDELCLDDAEVRQVIVNNFLKYLRSVDSGIEGEGYLSVEDVLDNSYIPDDDMIVIRFIINICRLIELNQIECDCGQCNCGATDVETQINENILSIICNNCGRRIDIELNPRNIQERFSDLNYINITTNIH